MAAPGSPVSVDFFSRFWANFFDEKQYITERTAGQAFFGRQETGSMTIFSPDALDVDMDITRGNEKPATLVVRGMAGRITGTTHVDMQIGQTSTFSRQFPLIEEQFNLGAAQINYRQPGEGPYQNVGPQARLRSLGTRAYLEGIRRIIRLQEILSWQSLRLGVQSISNIADTTTNIYDFRRNSANTPSLTHGWGNAAGVPMTDIDALCDTLLANGKLMPDFAIFGGTTMQYFLANSQVSTNYGNKLYFDLIQFSSKFEPGPEFAKFVAAGLIPYGQLRTPKGYTLTVFTYPYVYQSYAGSITKYFPDTGCLIGSSQARADRAFGPPEAIPLTSVDMQQIMEWFGINPMSPSLPTNVLNPGATIQPNEFYLRAQKSDDGKAVSMMIQAAPIFCTTQTDAFGYMVAGVNT